MLAAGIAGCSADTTRFGESPNANPYASRRTAAPAEVTGSVSQPAPVSRIEQQALPQVAQPLPAPPNPNRPATIASNGVSGGGQGLGSYNPASAAPAPAVRPATGGHDITGSVARPAQPAWSWDGGTAVAVGPGDTVDSLAHKYGVPASAIMQANNLANPHVAFTPGQRIVIPRYNQAGAAPARPQAPYTAAVKPTAPAASAGGNVHVVAPGETLMSIARLYHQPLTALAAANKIAPHTLVKIGDRLVIPGNVAIRQPAPAVAAPKLQAPARVQAPAANQRVVAAEPPATARLATPGTEVVAEEASSTASTGAPSFRWPVRGRVIAGFGPKANGQQNDGINLAIPEGTAVRAAEDGVVAYAGSELKGYGNLILIRHANGFVTAYAHASEIMVKRNDQVRRGQIIAKSGQTGTVATPQLHFEIRKGSAPVDPAQYLPAGA